MAHDVLNRITLVLMFKCTLNTEVEFIEKTHKINVPLRLASTVAQVPFYCSLNVNLTTRIAARFSKLKYNLPDSKYVTANVLALSEWKK
jgi:hypothetical protein